MLAENNKQIKLALKWKGYLHKEFVFYRLIYYGLKFMGLNLSYLCSSVIILIYTILHKKGRVASREYFKLVLRTAMASPNTFSPYSASEISLMKFIYNKLFNKKDNFIKTFIRTYVHFFRFGQILMDRTYITMQLKNPFKTTYSDPDKFLSAIHQEGGILIMSSHIGNFEYAGSLMKAFTKTTYLMMLKIHDEKLKRYLDALHAKRSYQVIDLSDPIKASQEAILKLKEGSVVCVMGDRDIENKSIKTTFLNETVYLPLGPFYLASFSNVPIIFIWCMKEKNKEYKVINVGPYKLKEASNSKERIEIAENLAHEFAREMEKVIREYPYQWFNFYNFWERK